MKFWVEVIICDLFEFVYLWHHLRNLAQNTKSTQSRFQKYLVILFYFLLSGIYWHLPVSAETLFSVYINRQHMCCKSIIILCISSSLIARLQMTMLMIWIKIGHNHNCFSEMKMSNTVIPVVAPFIFKRKSVRPQENVKVSYRRHLD